jgi:hypothetical protein
VFSFQTRAYVSSQEHRLVNAEDKAHEYKQEAEKWKIEHDIQLALNKKLHAELIGAKERNKRWESMVKNLNVEFNQQRQRWMETQEIHDIVFIQPMLERLKKTDQPLAPPNKNLQLELYMIARESWALSVDIHNEGQSMIEAINKFNDIHAAMKHEMQMLDWKDCYNQEMIIKLHATVDQQKKRLAELEQSSIARMTADRDDWRKKAMHYRRIMLSHELELTRVRAENYALASSATSTNSSVSSSPSFTTAPSMSIEDAEFAESLMNEMI